MTKRYVSFGGTLVVVAAVLLAGCGGLGDPPTDYAKKLVGTWTGMTTATIRYPPESDATIDGVPTMVTVEIVGGAVANKGTFSLTVVNTIPAPPAPMETMVSTEASGGFSVTASEIKGTVETLSDTAPDEIKALAGGELTIKWELLMNNDLKISSPPLFAVLGVMMPDLTLTKQAAES